MPEDTAPDATQDTPTPTDDAPPDSPDTDAVQSTDSTDSIDWEKRYSDLQPEYTRATQEASQYRRIIEAARQGDAEALEFLGLDLADTDDDDSDFDADEPISKAEFQDFLRQQQEQQELAAQEAEWEQRAEEHVDETLNKIDPEGKFDAEYIQFLLGAAEPNDEGLPDIESAHQRFEQFVEARRKEWVDTKRTFRAPGGASPSKQPNLDDPEERREYLAQQLLANG